MGDGRSRLAADQVVAARGSWAHRTLLEPEMSLAAGIAPGGSRGGRRRRSARSLSCPIFRQPCCRPIGRSQSLPTSSSTSNFGAFDEPRAADADQAADRPRRRPWWASASIRARQQRQPSQAAPADRRADAVGGLQCSRCMAICGALDVQGAVDTGRAADRPQRRPWWAAERL